jgi:fatty acid desaturase
MPYLLAIVLVAIAAVFFIFLGVWGGILWVVFAAVMLGVLFVARGREVKVDRAKTGPTGTTRASGGGAETANERVGQT